MPFGRSSELAHYRACPSQLMDLGDRRRKFHSLKRLVNEIAFEASCASLTFLMLPVLLRRAEAMRALGLMEEAGNLPIRPSERCL
jgi:hypothetical protein